MSANAGRRSVAKAAGFPDEVAQVDDQLGTVHQVGPVQRQGTGQLLGLGEQLQRRALLEFVDVDVRQLVVLRQQRAGLRVREGDAGLETRGSAEGLPAWSFAAAIALPNGSFAVLY